MSKPVKKKKPVKAGNRTRHRRPGIQRKRIKFQKIEPCTTKTEPGAKKRKETNLFWLGKKTPTSNPNSAPSAWDPLRLGWMLGVLHGSLGNRHF